MKKSESITIRCLHDNALASAFEIGLAENVQRQTLNPVEEGLAFRKYVNEFGWGGVSELAQKISESQLCMQTNEVIRITKRCVGSNF